LQARLDAHKAAPELVPPLRALDAAIHGSGLEPSLIELVKIRASQINGCAYCLQWLRLLPAYAYRRRPEAGRE
jgi:alkylhydroperoxidase family enzyme